MAERTRISKGETNFIEMREKANNTLFKMITLFGRTGLQAINLWP